ncbi:MAG: NAD(P)-binding domain-containing protein [Devosia sp.]
MMTTLPIAIIGAGPVGLAAAAQLVERGLTPLVFERGASVGGAMMQWSHVRVFSPWRFNIDLAARRLLEASGWIAPDDDELPTGRDIVSHYLKPLASLPALADSIILNATVSAVSRDGLDKMSNADRDNTPFAVRWTDGDGVDHSTRARAVIDASGTWHRPNPIGIDGLPVPGEIGNERIAYGIPDIEGSARDIYAGKRVLVIGSGHSAIQAALGLLALQASAPDTKVIWALRRNRIDKLLGGGLNDQLPARGALGLAARRAINEGRLDILASFAVQRIRTEGDRLAIEATLSARAMTVEADRVIVATGFRPDLDMLRELRVQLDPAVEAPPMLAPLIDPNFHSCGSVPPHGIDELIHPEKNFTIVGSKSYGRAPTFLMATGYEQVRSIADELAGNPIAARQVQLVLPETGVCSSSRVFGESASSCCGGPAKVAADACCVADEVAKAEGQAGCGCGVSSKATTTTPALALT